MSSTFIDLPGDNSVFKAVMDVRVSKDLLHWSEPVRMMRDGKEFGNHYNAMVANDDKNQPCMIDCDEFSILCNHNGTDVIRYKAKLEKR